MENDLLDRFKGEVILFLIYFSTISNLMSLFFSNLEKALFGDVNTHQRNVLPQAEGYVHRFGPGE